MKRKIIGLVFVEVEAVTYGIPRVARRKIQKSRSCTPGDARNRFKVAQRIVFFKWNFPSQVLEVFGLVQSACWRRW
jgi:hypothetical protein